MEGSLVFIVTGHQGSGKTSFLEQLIKSLESKGISLAGFLAISTSRDDDQLAYSIKNITSGEMIPLASQEFYDNWSKIGSFYFNPRAIIKGNTILADPNIHSSDLVVIDEIGPFELNDKIWSGSVTPLVSDHHTPMIWIVRKSLVGQVVEKWNLEEVIVFDIEDTSVEEASEMIISRLG